MGRLFDRLAGSPAWLRLQERSPTDADPYAVGVKHDLVNVLQAVVAAADESLTAAEDAKGKVDRLDRQLYDPEDGDFTKQRAYTDSRYNAWANWLKVVAGGIAVALFTFLLQRGG